MCHCSCLGIDLSCYWRMVVVVGGGLGRWWFGDAWGCQEGIGVECNIDVAVVVPK